MAKKCARKPWGEGPAALMKKERKRKARKLARWICPNLNVDRIEETGHLWPRGSLRKKEVGRLFKGWLGKTNGSRWFTERVVRSMVKKILAELPFVPVRGPQVTYAQYVAQATSHFLKLVRLAKKHMWSGAQAWHLYFSQLNTKDI